MRHYKDEDELRNELKAEFMAFGIIAFFLALLIGVYYLAYYVI